MTNSERAQVEGRAYIALLFAGTAEIVIFGGLYLAYTWLFT